MPKTRRLEDLYVLGKEVAFNDNTDGPPVKVWLQKLNPLEHEKAIRRANAAKARVLMSRNDETSEEWLNAYERACQLEAAPVDHFGSGGEEFGGRDALVNQVIAERLVEIFESREAELATAEEWSKDDYLQGLQDAWEDGLRDRYLEDPPDEEAVRVYNELARFQEAVRREVDPEAEALRRDYTSWDDERLRRSAVNAMLGTRASVVWINEFRRSQVWLGTKTAEDHDTLYFESREAVDTLYPEILGRLRDEFEALDVGLTEGKDLPPTRSSSPPSAPSVGAATAGRSGRRAVAR